jgi:hypothetical protein
MSDQEPKLYEYHDYHAEATVLQGHLTLPLVQEIQKQAHSQLPEEGGYISQQANDYRLEGVISYKSAYTQVAGNPGSKEEHKWSTLATSVVEGLNIMDVVTADRIVAQVSLDHPPQGYIPYITFLGTRFENLQIAGHRVEPSMALDLFGVRPKDDDTPYSKFSWFRNKVAAQQTEVLKHPNLLKELIERYTGFSRPIEKVENSEAVECSLVNQADGGSRSTSRGHVIHVPDFGTICLARVRLEQSDPSPTTSVPRRTKVHLHMLDLHMGCVAAGKATVGGLTTNGMTRP